MATKAEKALEAYRGGFNCAQALFAAFCTGYGLDEKTGLKIACGLGGGCRCGEICGALSGAILVIGLRDGQDDAADMAAKERCYRQTMALTARFEDENGGLRCSDLLGLDVQDAALMQANREKAATICEGLIFSAASLLEEMGY